jgi:spore coat polysaccharide biosynthesis predicted glycosyltransferase SpsG
MGGADRNDVTGRVVEALAEDVSLPPAVVVVGGSYPHLARLRKRIQPAAGRVRLEVDVAHMSTLMTRARLAICAGGGTVLELCRLGVPMLVVALADNQRPIAAAVAAHGVGWSLGWHEDLDGVKVHEAVRRRLHDAAGLATGAAHGRALVDGYGSGRVADAIRYEKE